MGDFTWADFQRTETEERVMDKPMTQEEFAEADGKQCPVCRSTYLHIAGSRAVYRVCWGCGTRYRAKHIHKVIGYKLISRE